MIFETNIFIGIIISVAVDCKSDSRQGYLKQRYLIKIKCRNTHLILVRICYAYCFG